MFGVNFSRCRHRYIGRSVFYFKNCDFFDHGQGTKWTIKGRVTTRTPMWKAECGQDGR